MLALLSRPEFFMPVAIGLVAFLTCGLAFIFGRPHGVPTVSHYSGALLLSIGVSFAAFVATASPLVSLWSQAVVLTISAMTLVSACIYGRNFSKRVD